MKTKTLTLEITEELDLLLALLQQKNHYTASELVEGMLRSVFKKEIEEIERTVGEFKVMDFSYEEAKSYILKGETDSVKIKANLRKQSPEYCWFKRELGPKKVTKKSKQVK
jgi:hypothetical protein